MTVLARLRVRKGRTEDSVTPGIWVGIGGDAALQMTARYQGAPTLPKSDPKISQAAANSNIDTPAPARMATSGPSGRGERIVVITCRPMPVFHASGRCPSG